MNDKGSKSLFSFSRRTFAFQPPSNTTAYALCSQFEWSVQHVKMPPSSIWGLEPSTCCWCWRPKARCSPRPRARDTGWWEERSQVVKEIPLKCSQVAKIRPVMVIQVTCSAITWFYVPVSTRVWHVVQCFSFPAVLAAFLLLESNNLNWKII